MSAKKSKELKAMYARRADAVFNLPDTQAQSPWPTYFTNDGTLIRTIWPLFGRANLINAFETLLPAGTA